MTRHGTDISHGAGGGLLGWLGFGRNGERVEDHFDRADLVRQARQQLLQRISAFLLDNELEVTAHNLAAAHSAFAGLDPGLERRIRRRLESGDPITQAWLDRSTAKDDPAGDDAINKLAQ